MEVKRDRFATVTDVPGICQFRDDVEGHRIVGARTDETVISRRCRSVDPAEGGLVHVKQRNHLVAGADKLAPIPGFIAVRGGERCWPFADQVSVRLRCRLRHDSHGQSHYSHEANPPSPPEDSTRHHVCTSSSLLLASYTCSLLSMTYHGLSGMRQFREIQPDVVHPRIRATHIRCERPALDKIPTYMMQVKPMQNKVGCIIHGHLVHLPNELLTGGKVSGEFLLLKEFIEVGKGVALIPASAIGHKPLAEGINRIIEIHGGPQQREDVVAGHLVTAMLRYEHRLKLNVDIDLLE